MTFGWKNSFLNFGTVFFTAMKMMKFRKAHCSSPQAGEDNSMVFTSHSVPLPARVTGHSWLEMAPHERQKPFHFLQTSDSSRYSILLLLCFKQECIMSLNAYDQNCKANAAIIASSPYKYYGKLYSDWQCCDCN